MSDVPSADTASDRPADYGYHDIAAIAARFPDGAESILVDSYINDTPVASARVFRIYHPLPAHYHEQCDEHLYLFSGEVVFQIADDAPQTLVTGQMVVFKRKVVHAITEIRREPAVFLTVDTPRRAPDDVVFVDPDAAGGRAFVSSLDNA